ncbi:hydroxymethylpyrimidine/phosphomethylpyrimidine kinase [Flavobacterium cheongpyeongense]|uniref:hydroxymethylpyrimidine kinase n=1 Tax=Flavobacterium cheongpyeongense TaxID=2212651 RepID=A0A2V4BIY6_9FLAO|nr:hydroxymethylpyrimidine/phosphomethylpyrimidine kinase [Flavobacterium cheongpyeongense]PXY38926.1 hydroxymethylpyrimidine/phosphomethylpyrimidine kinase [Flavobacterium cheongpyeongense]
MSKNRPFALSIAGLDPSGGAGILADSKTFEQHQVQGLAISTANTIQTDSKFYEIEWTSIDFVLRSIKKLFKNYPIKSVKIGIVPSVIYLNEVVSLIKKLSPNALIVWDTVLKSSTEFEFLPLENHSDLQKTVSKIDLITPNYEEIMQLYPHFFAEKLWVKNELPTAILLKGGHNLAALGTDYLFLKSNLTELNPTKNNFRPKHGSGCVLSSAIAANLALGYDLKTACLEAKVYIEKYLNSTSTLIGYHYV